jgi:hypothetical protein
LPQFKHPPDAVRNPFVRNAISENGKCEALFKRKISEKISISSMTDVNGYGKWPSTADEMGAVNQQFLSHAIWSRPVSFQRMQMDGTNSIEQAMRRTK